MKSVATILTLLVGSSSAFAPVATNTRASSAVSATSFSDRPGVIVPTGYFDPLNLATSEEKFEQFRAAEIKHGRVAMLAVVGYVVPEFYRWGGEINFGLKFADIPNGIAAISAVPTLGWLQIFFLIGAVDYVSTHFDLKK
jgi:Chlorophyll A-B binding protein